VIGTRENIKEAREALGRLLEDLERTNFTAELGEGVNLTELIPFLRGRNGVEAERLSKKFDVRLDFSKKGEPDRIVIRGVREKVEACETFLRKKIEDEESKLSQEVSIDSRVHSRIIGGQGKTLAKIQEKYKVNVLLLNISVKNEDLKLSKISSFLHISKSYYILFNKNFQIFNLVYRINIFAYLYNFDFELNEIENLFFVFFKSKYTHLIS
jgi:rRNA processing protein Krr1/Pno1